jgi:hypothetical protein
MIVSCTSRKRKERMKLSFSQKLVQKLVWVPVIWFCKISFPVMHLILFCRNWPFSPPNFMFSILSFLLHICSCLHFPSALSLCTIWCWVSCQERPLGWDWWCAQYNEQGWDHCMTLRSGVANSTENGQYYTYNDHHQKIMSYNVIKKIT